MSESFEYGNYYWYVRLPNDDLVYLYADRIDVTASGALLLIGHNKAHPNDFVHAVYAPGTWLEVQAASLLDGRAVTVEQVIPVAPDLPKAQRSVERLPNNTRFLEQYGDQPCVYVLHAGDRYKIGMTSNLRKRIGQLQTGTPHPIEIVTIIPAARPAELEAELHARYAAKRVHGEWFALDGDDVAALLRQGVQP